MNATRPGLGWKHLYWILPSALVVVAAVAVVALVVVGTVLTPRSTPVEGGSAPGSPANFLADGFTVAPLGDAPVQISVYVDYLCPYCGEFEQINGGPIEEWVESGEATLTVHPIAILTSRSNGTRYSERAAAAAACVGAVEPGSFYAFHSALFAQQPREGTDGLSDPELTDLAATEAGATDPDTAACIAEGRYRGWVQDATERATSAPLPGTDSALRGTPTVLVNGATYPGSTTDAAAFARFVAAQR
jgi:protein-disulfide isomerase